MDWTLGDTSRHFRGLRACAVALYVEPLVFIVIHRFANLDDQNAEDATGRCVTFPEIVARADNVHTSGVTIRLSDLEFYRHQATIA